MMQKLNCCQDFLEGRSTTSIRRWWLIKKSGFWGGGLLKCDRNFPIFVQKSPKKWTFGQKSGGLFEFSSSGGLIKSGIL